MWNAIFKIIIEHWFVMLLSNFILFAVHQVAFLHRAIDQRSLPRLYIFGEGILSFKCIIKYLFKND